MRIDAYTRRVARRQISVRLDTELLDAVRTVIGPIGLMSEVFDAALRTWLATNQPPEPVPAAAPAPEPASVAAPEPASAVEPVPAPCLAMPAMLPWNAYRPPGG
jgi:hypothetical protein